MTRSGLIVGLVLGMLALGACKRGSGTVVVQDPGPGQRQQAFRLIEEAIKAEKAGEQAKAIQLYQDSLNFSEDFAIAWHNLAMLYAKRGGVGDRMQAVEMLKNAVALEPDRADSYYCIGYIYDESGQPDKALEYFKQALQRDRLHLYSLRGVARVGKVRFIADKESLEWMKTALLIENDPTWRRVFEEEKLRIEGALHTAGSAGKF